MARMRINEIQVIVAPGRNLLAVKVITDQTLGGVGDPTGPRLGQVEETASVTA
jgi:hypothetical protein